MARRLLVARIQLALLVVAAVLCAVSCGQEAPKATAPAPAPQPPATAAPEPAPAAVPKASAPEPQVPIGLLVGQRAPDFEATDVDGVRFKLSDYRGKVVVLDFWGIW